MGLSTGTRLGAYEIHSAIGAGGMGEVYQARDTKLGRAVAIKVLPDALAFDQERIARFEREAKALAALNHPHIAALHGMEESEGRHFLVMELVEGETLADRLRRGAMPVGDALKLAHQIADALEAAHEKGIVHRDLKPANIKITPDEKVKVLDFGLAKAMESAPAESNLSHSPTLSIMATQAGVILGTASYMSPEQAKGFPADHRSDVFSFGVVLYEMLTGRQPFKGETAPEVLASVLVRDPDFTALPPDVNPRIVDVLRRCLDKHPKRRWQAIGDLRAEIEAVASAPHAPPAAAGAAVPRPLWRRALPPAGAALAASAITAAIMRGLTPAPAVAPIVRFPVLFGEGQQLTQINRHLVAIAPDGARIAYIANQRMYLRSMAEVQARALPGTDQDPSTPTFSPDGRWVAYYSTTDRALRKAPAVGGAALTICPLDVAPFGMSWRGNQIVLAHPERGVLRVSENGGGLEPLAAPKAGEVLSTPDLLPDDRTLIYSATTRDGGADRWDRGRVVAVALDTGSQTTLIEGASDGRYVPTGHLLYAHSGIVFAVTFDAARRQVTGAPIPIIEGVRRATVSAAAQFAVSRTGTLVYVPGPTATAAGQQDLGMIDLQAIVQPMRLPPGTYRAPRVSPNGKLVAFGTDDGAEAIVWIYDLSGASSMRRLTFGGRNRYPIWSRDGQWVAFQSDRDGDVAIYRQKADGTGTAERLTKADPDTAQIPQAWSPVEDRFLFTVLGKDRTYSLWTFSMADRKAAALSGITSANPPGAVFSPDGRWMAYAMSNTSLGARIYIQPFPPTGATYQITKDSAAQPTWTRDGKIYFIPSPGQLRVVQITTEPNVSFTNPAFVPRGFSTSDPANPRNYDMLPDGKRLVGMITAGQTQGGTAVAQELQVVVNWYEELKQRVPVK